MSISRNAPCPCGSGKKYKQCCGQSGGHAPASPATNVAALLQQAFTLHRSNRLEQAEAIYRQILAQQPDQPDALHLLGQVAETTGRQALAIDLVSKAVARKPGEALYRVSFARLLQKDKPEEAETHARKALQLQPSLHEARYFLANALKYQSRQEEAVTEYRQVLAAQPEHLGALNNLGSSLNDLHQFGEAFACLEKFFARQPNAYDSICGMANVLRNMGRFEEAIPFHERALLMHDEVEMRFGIGLCALGMGRLDRGWLEYETRFLRREETATARVVNGQHWQGEPLSGKRLLIWGEQGVGDEILFAAEIGDAVAAGAQVTVLCEPRLQALFARSFPQVDVRTRHARGYTAPAHSLPDVSEVDFDIPASSLARFFRPRLEDFPLRASFLVPDPYQVSRWKTWLGSLPDGLKIGISWRSMLRGAERNHFYSDLNQWGAIFALPGISLVNLQYGDCREELAEAEKQFGITIHQAPELDLKNDLDGAAALTRALDAVIAPNSSVFAMAGAVGTPTWLLNLDSDWTMLGTEGVPWFPAVKVCRKDWQAPWEQALQIVADDLKKGHIPQARIPQRLFPAPAGDVATLLAQGYQQMQAGALLAAEFVFWRVLSIEPEHPDALNLLALVFLQGKNPVAAIPLLRRAIAARPEQAAYPNNLGNALRDMGRTVEARASYEQAIQVDPGYARAHNNLGVALKKLDQAEPAEAHFRRAIELEPQAASYHANLGNALLDQGRPDAAIPVLEQALALNPNLPEALSSMGAALQFMPDGRTRALSFHERAISFMPEDFMARWRMSTTLLASGDLARGWTEYGWRFKTREGFRCAYPQRPWAGETLAGKRVLVWGEQGVGDEILFAGLLPDILSTAAQVTLVCEPRLQTLFARSFPTAQVVAQAFPLEQALRDPGVDYQLPSGDIARWMRLKIEQFSTHAAFLKPDPVRVAHWKNWLSSLGNQPKIGISWRSMVRGKFRNSYYTDLDQWGAILKIPGVIFVNLQYGDCREELEEARRLFGVAIHEAPGLNLKDDLDEAAALTRALDLVIAPNTSVFAMAGAVGTPTWLLNLDCDWTMLGTDHVPWFPSVEVFRKGWGEPWEPMLAEVAGRLAVMGNG
jgi:tetratricopeptide (TPR) repeat protein